MQVASHMPQGKAVDLRGRQFVVRLKEFFDQERRAGAMVSTRTQRAVLPRRWALGNGPSKTFSVPITALGNAWRPLLK